MATPSSICDLNEDILALICSAINHQYVHGRVSNRPSVLAFSETCKLLRTVAAPTIFNTLVLWNWDSFCETARMMRASEHARLFTRCVDGEETAGGAGSMSLHGRTLRVTPIVERPLPPSNEKYGTAGLRATRFDLSLPKAGSRAHTNSQLHYGRRAVGVPQPETAYMPLANLDDGPNICVDEHASALADLLLSFENLTKLVFGLGAGPSTRPPFEDSIISVLRAGKLDACVFSNITQLDIEDTALFWTTVFPNVRDLTMRLGYSMDGVELDRWRAVESVQSLRVSGTAHCGSSSQVNYGWFGIERREHACGPALTKALPNTTSLDLMDCTGDFEAVLESLKGFALVQHLHVRASLANLGETPSQGLNEDRRAAELAKRKREADMLKLQPERRNEKTQAALNLVKRIALKTFPRLLSLKIGDKIAYDLTQLQSRIDPGELDRLMMITDVSLDEIR